MENGLFLKEVGIRIRTLRKERNMTLTRMSEITQIDRCNLTHLELRGKNAYILTLKAIAKCLEVDIKELFEGL